MFGRYSFADFTRDGPAPSATWWRPGVRQHFARDSLKCATIGSRRLRLHDQRTLVTDFRFGFFRYKVNVLPFDVGSSPAADAGMPGLNLDDFFSSGMPAFIDRRGE